MKRINMSAKQQSPTAAHTLVFDDAESEGLGAEQAGAVYGFDDADELCVDVGGG